MECVVVDDDDKQQLIDRYTYGQGADRRRLSLPLIKDARLAELLQLIPPFDRRGRQRDKGLVHMIVEGEKPLPPDLISMIVARAGVPQEPPH